MNFSSIRNGPFFRYGCGGGLALATAWFAASVLPEYMVWLVWMIFAAAVWVIGKQAWFDWRDMVDSKAEDAALEDSDGRD